MEQKKLSIVIGTYNRLELLQQCLNSLIGKVRVKHEIIVVDAGSTDGTLDYLKGLDTVRLVSDQGLIGQAQSLNRIFRALKSKYVCWLSDDNVAQPGMLDQAVAILERNPTIGLVSLKVKDVSGHFSDLEYLGGTWPSGILNCNQGMLSVKLMQRLGGFDEQFRDYGIDIDLTTRVLLAGYRVVYTKQITIHHIRDHDTESWTDSEGRMQKMAMAKKLYKQKFEALIKSEFDGPYNKLERKHSPQLRNILLFYRRARNRGLRIEKWTGLVERDWKNLFMARFVSKWDFLINMIKPYYFVQGIPSGLLQEIAVKSANKEGIVH
jgi:GT2 family glycosyltransferase